MLRKSSNIIFLFIVSVWFAPANAVLNIEITQGVTGAMPVAVVPFSWEGGENMPLDVSQVIQADLRRSGRFSLLPEADMLAKPTLPKQVNFQNWRTMGVEALLIGQLKQEGTDSFAILFYLLDPFTGNQIIAYRIPARSGNLRAAAHHVADLIYEKLTGQKGAFNTRLAYVSVRGGEKNKQFSLMVADADGANPREVLKSNAPIMSPAWSPDGKQLAYVSFEKDRSQIFVQDLRTGQRKVVSKRDGVNGAPAWSPDGKKLALTLSNEGNLDIYILNLETSDLTRLTKNGAIDTEPNWAPDGRSLVFTSGRAGAAQIYKISVSDGEVTRVSYEGDYNARPRFSHDGTAITMVTRGRSGYQIALLNLASQQMRVLTQGRLDESPDFSPNDALVIYANNHQGVGVLSSVSVDGLVTQRLSSLGEDIREPAWSPFIKN